MEKELKAIAAEHLVEMYPTDQEAKDNNVHLYEYIEDKNNQLITTEAEFK